MKNAALKVLRSSVSLACLPAHWSRPFSEKVITMEKDEKISSGGFEANRPTEWGRPRPAGLSIWPPSMNYSSEQRIFCRHHHFALGVKSVNFRFLSSCCWKSRFSLLFLSLPSLCVLFPPVLCHSNEVVFKRGREKDFESRYYKRRSMRRKSFRRENDDEEWLRKKKAFPKIKSFSSDDHRWKKMMMMSMLMKNHTREMINMSGKFFFHPPYEWQQSSVDLLCIQLVDSRCPG